MSWGGTDLFRRHRRCETTGGNGGGGGEEAGGKKMLSEMLSKEQILEVKSFPLRSIKKFYMKATSGQVKMKLFHCLRLPKSEKSRVWHKKLIWPSGLWTKTMMATSQNKRC